MGDLLTDALCHRVSPSASQMLVVPNAAEKAEAGGVHPGFESQTEVRRQRCLQMFRAWYQGVQEMSRSLPLLITHSMIIDAI